MEKARISVLGNKAVSHGKKGIFRSPQLTIVLQVYVGKYIEWLNGKNW